MKLIKEQLFKMESIFVLLLIYLSVNPTWEFTVGYVAIISYSAFCILYKKGKDNPSEDLEALKIKIETLSSMIGMKTLGKS